MLSVGTLLGLSAGETHTPKGPRQEMQIISSAVIVQLRAETLGTTSDTLKGHPLVCLNDPMVTPPMSPKERLEGIIPHGSTYRQRLCKTPENRGASLHAPVSSLERSIVSRNRVEASGKYLAACPVL